MGVDQVWTRCIPGVHQMYTRCGPGVDQVCSRRPTCFYHMLNGGEALADSGADRAEDEDGGEVDVAHHGPTEQAAVLIPALDTAGDSETGGRQQANIRTDSRQTDTQQADRQEGRTADRLTGTW